MPGVSMRLILPMIIVAAVGWPWSQSLSREVQCTPKSNAARILQSPNPNDVHPNWSGQSNIGMSWTFVRQSAVSGPGGEYLRGTLISPRGGETKNITVFADEWNCGNIAAADTQKKRFLEFPTASDVKTYDLNTVQLIQPGKFTIIYTRVGNPDFMQDQLKVFDTLRTYCTRADGVYPAPTDFLTSGPPDMPIQNIEVRSGKAKVITWSSPYSKFGYYNGDPYKHIFLCASEQQYYEDRRSIMDGDRSKELYDCKRGLRGVFAYVNDDITKAIMTTPREGSLAMSLYVKVCRAVTNEEPYVPRD
jgi:hypothetical protein